MPNVYIIIMSITLSLEIKIYDYESEFRKNVWNNIKRCNSKYSISIFLGNKNLIVIIAQKFRKLWIYIIVHLFKVYNYCYFIINLIIACGLMMKKVPCKSEKMLFIAVVYFIYRLFLTEWSNW